MDRRAIVIKAIANLLFLLLLGCAAPSPVGPIPDKELLNFLEEGKTTKQMVLERLGQPSGSYENNRILTYRVGSEDGKGYFIDEVQRTRWFMWKYSLVLVFDENGILMKKSLVSIR